MEVLSDRTESYVQAIDGEMGESNTDDIIESQVNQALDNDNLVDGSENGNSDDLDLKIIYLTMKNNNNFTYDENLTLQENINESKNY